MKTGCAPSSCQCPCHRTGLNTAHIAPCCDTPPAAPAAHSVSRSQLDNQSIDDLVSIIADMHRPSTADPSKCMECQRPTPCDTRKVLLDYDAETIRRAAEHRRTQRPQANTSEQHSNPPRAAT